MPARLPGLCAQLAHAACSCGLLGAAKWAGQLRAIQLPSMGQCAAGDRPGTAKEALLNVTA